MSRYPKTKSQLWAEIKAIGNPAGLKWSSPISTMYEKVQEYTRSQQRRETTGIETHFDPWLVRENDL
jgi:hypothetical protein